MASSADIIAEISDSQIFLNNPNSTNTLKTAMMTQLCVKIAKMIELALPQSVAMVNAIKASTLNESHQSTLTKAIEDRLEHGLVAQAGAKTKSGDTQYLTSILNYLTEKD